MNQPGKVTNPVLVISWTRKINFPCPRIRLRIWSRETGSAVSSRASLLILQIQAESGARGLINVFYFSENLEYFRVLGNRFLINRALHCTLFLFGTDGYGFREPQVQMFRCYGLYMITVENGRFRKNSVCCGPIYGSWSSLRFGYGPVYDSRLSLRVGFGPVYTQHFFQNCDISHAFNFRYAFTASYQLFYISTSAVSPAAASCADCTSWTHWFRISCCVAMMALYV